MVFWARISLLWGLAYTVTTVLSSVLRQPMRPPFLGFADTLGGQYSLEENYHSVIKLPWGLHRCPQGPGDRHVCVGTARPRSACPFVLIAKAQGPSSDVRFGMSFHSCCRESRQVRGQAAGVSVSALDLRDLCSSRGSAPSIVRSCRPDR